MKRKEYTNLLKWKNSKNRKPLIIRGARQVGKTWLMKEFGEKAYKQYMYVNLETHKHLKQVFEQYDINLIIDALQIETSIKFDAKNTLIILDEIQEVPEALNSLKYFYENVPHYHIIAAGSLLGVALHKNTSFPVGKVDFLNLYPLNFKEFLHALNENALIDLIENANWELIKTFKNKYIEKLKQYYFVGGMPEAVVEFSNNKDYKKIREIQNNILSAYEQDFSKHAPTTIIPRIRMVWNSIPAQLSKENKKFIYGLLKKGARAKEYELALSWLVDTGLVYKIHNVNKPAIPLKAYEDLNTFKLFVLDTGLLSALSQLDTHTLLEGNSIFEEFKGALTEQYVLQQLTSQKDLYIYYWSSQKSKAEIDFLIQTNNKIIPLEVKAAENLQAKSLKVFAKKYKPLLSIRTSMSDFRKETWMVNIPLYTLNSHIWNIKI